MTSKAMKTKAANAVFKPRPSLAEARSDTTTRVARDIVNGEALLMAEKTERLRAARLALETPAAPVPLRGRRAQSGS